MELKDGTKPPSARQLTDDETEWHAGWRGQVVVVNSIAEAMAVLARVPDEAKKTPAEAG